MGDPNAIANRCDIVAPGQVLLLPERIEESLNNYRYGSWFMPTARQVLRTRELVAMELRARHRHGFDMLSLADFQRFYERHPAMMRRIMGELAFFEPTLGCWGHCANICGVPLFGRPQAQLPFELFEWMFSEFSAELKRSRPGLYHGSDLIDYESDGKSGVDLLKLYNVKLGFFPYVSIRISFHRRAIDFLYRALVLGEVPIQRISRLPPFHEEHRFDELVQRLRQRAGGPLSRQVLAKLRYAFDKGGKSSISTKQGAGWKPQDGEATLSDHEIYCFNGMGISTGMGFATVYTRPLSTLFPSGAHISPLLPDETGAFTLVKHVQHTAHVAPWYKFRHFVLDPQWIVYEAQGNMVDEPSTQEQQHIKALSAYKRAMHDLSLSVGSRDQRKIFHSRVSALNRQFNWKQAVIGSRDLNEALHRLNTDARDFLNGLSVVLDRRKKLVKENMDRPKVLAELMCHELGFDDFVRLHFGRMKKLRKNIELALARLQALGQLSPDQAATLQRKMSTAQKMDATFYQLMRRANRTNADLCLKFEDEINPVLDELKQSYHRQYGRPVQLGFMLLGLDFMRVK